MVLETRDRHRYEDHLLAAKQAAEMAGEQAASLAATLQGTLIPPHPPAIPHLDIHALYRPAGSGREVGGDFYDVFQVGPDAWLVVLGDVSGKGIPAAVVTSFIRYTIRSLAIAHPDPADLLGALDEAVRAHGTDHFCTVVAVRLERVGTRWDLALALAGHPPALVRRPDGTTYELGVPGTPVGLMTQPEFRTVRQALDDLTVTLYTDGVTEARSSGGMFGEERLVALVAAPAPAARDHRGHRRGSAGLAVAPRERRHRDHHVCGDLTRGSPSPDSAACPSRTSQSVLDAPEHRLGAARGPDLAVARADVGLHRVDAQEEALGDLVVAAAGGDELEHLELALGEPVRPARRRRLGQRARTAGRGSGRGDRRGALAGP